MDMVYLIDEYYERFPERKNTIRPLFDKFIGTEKYLHEYTIDELNAEVSNWDALKMSSFKVRKNALSLYFDWLNKQGVDVDPNITKEIVFPEKEEKFLIYSTNEIHSLWDDYYLDIELNAIKNNKPVVLKPLLVCYVAGILAFYGLNKEQIMSLQLSDVQESGIIGYDLPLTKKDIEVLLRYKGYQAYDNGKKLIGTTYIRSTSPEPSDTILNMALRKSECSEDMSGVKTILNYNNLYLFGLFNRIFEYEKTHSPKLDNRNGAPDWFKKFINESGNSISKKEKSDATISKTKIKYIKYRTERIAYINIMTNQIKNVESMNKIMERFEKVINEINDNRIKNELFKIENSIKQLVKN